MVVSMVGSSYKLLMVSRGWECSAMSLFTWFNIVCLNGTEYMELIDCCPSGMFNSRVSVIRLVMFAFTGMN